MSRPSSSPAFVNHLLVYAMVAMGSCGSLGLGMVWIRHQISVEANENKVLQARIEDTERKLDETRAAVAAEMDPTALLKRNADWNLQLAPAAADQEQQVTGDPMLRLAEKRNRGLFGDQPVNIGFRVAMQP
jgi:hypothetical protein